MAFMPVNLHLDPQIDSLINRRKSNKLGLKLTQDPLKYASCPEAELRPGKTQQSCGQTHLLGTKMIKKRSDHFHTETGFFNEI